ncbi:MAG: hypothetical protein U5K31_14735 [Balneolaceae bacterium]|nr:hypothetical protein [Balneolaceae bacterium]
MAWLYLLLSAGCSLLIAHLLKVCEHRQMRTLPTLTVNYLVAAAIALALDPLAGSVLHTLFTPLPLIFCALTGAFFILNFVLYSKSVHLNGVGVTVAAMRVSLFFPVLLSLAVYRESLTTLKGAGIAGVFFALLLLVPKRSRSWIRGVDAGWMLAGIFLLTGLADSALKVYQEEFGGVFGEVQFMGMIFLSAFLIGLVMLAIRRSAWPRPREVVLGALIGLPNLYSGVFLIRALRGMDGAVAFPAVNALIVLGGTLLGLAVWKDRVSRRQWAGIVLAILAMALLL